MNIFYAMIVAMLFASPVNATKPCGDDSWFANQKRTNKEWFDQADRVFVGNITSIDNGKYDKKLSVTILSKEKGYLENVTHMTITQGYCAPEMPTDLSKKYRFYIARNYSKYPASVGSYIFYDAVQLP